MKAIKNIVAVIAFSVISGAAFAQTITATASTLDGAEAKIAAQASAEGARYNITEASAGNRIHMTAELKK
ncbi:MULTISPECIES: YdgH/BhsA/McbA-like domain containing protein [Tatumella]|uniref:YdgH/BhsA/McbA-like domain containing protein n=1 Tax=Tatumella punctata TaxID=399969 RepID=A0ABW1VRM4_9GAMM|nr:MULTISPECIES: YdgH/BhsA/McbA-like domain containing protein [unclassified Tatumella]MBS0856722.1 DUF1471 domain-containing protein [Tatumella sp. JGM16]MBS0877721.1 DUF1471 domain-containing protein [Tatumella sp. JGM82]MBS0891490.1 DUF1471 domain-containing protein [Tatumella sp. JGM94]MBS0894471.1 DUF1471 domain-containing protein [Tatumella sp. JGM130]MBS0902356.1 DUF1471 domain-containing protein [Tatumella sp. JGM100]